MHFTYLIVYFVAYSEYLPPMGRRHSVKNIAPTLERTQVKQVTVVSLDPV